MSLKGIIVTWQMYYNLQKQDVRTWNAKTEYSLLNVVLGYSYIHTYAHLIILQCLIRQFFITSWLAVKLMTIQGLWATRMCRNVFTWMWSALTISTGYQTHLTSKNCRLGSINQYTVWVRSKQFWSPEQKYTHQRISEVTQNKGNG